MIRCIVKFDDGVPDDVQAKCMFDFEVNLRERSGADVRVFKERMADDSKLRVVMDKRRSANPQAIEFRDRFNTGSWPPAIGTTTVTILNSKPLGAP